MAGTEKIFLKLSPQLFGTAEKSPSSIFGTATETPMPDG